MDIEYTIQIWREGQQFVAHAMPLDVMSCGKTPDQARRALVEAVDLFLATAAQINTLGDVLQEAGYQPAAGGWVSPAWIATERHSALIAA